MTKKYLFTFISLMLFTFLPMSTAFSKEETLDSLKRKEEEILKKLYSNTEDSKEALENIAADDTTNEPLNLTIQVKNKNNTDTYTLYKNNFMKRIAKRKNIRKQISLRKEQNITNQAPLQPVIIASNKIIEIDNNKINTELNNHIRKANIILKEVKKTSSKKVISKEYFTISTDYFDDEESENNTSYVYVTDDVSLHTLPSLSSKLIYLVKANTRLKLDKNHGAWYRVKSADNKYGWILGDMINFSDPNSFSTLKNKGKAF